MTGRTVSIDPHVHSAGSYDADVPVTDLLAAARDAGLDAVAVTDHDAIEHSLRAVELAPEYGLLAIPGVEVSTAAGHLLAVGVEECPAPGRPLVETVETVRAAGGVAVVAHPFQVLRHGIRRRRIGYADAIEVFNALTITGVQNRRAQRFAAARGYPMLGGSDAHAAAMVGRTYTEVDVDADASDPTELDPASVLDAIRDGATVVEGERTPIGHYVRKFTTNVEYRTGAAIETGVAEVRATATAAADALAGFADLGSDGGVAGPPDGFEDVAAD
ncbi:MAG: CehA/McbA family metallohydrolase [Haloarculaceae archaeon]